MFLLTCGSKLPLNKWDPTSGMFNIINGRKSGDWD